MIGSYFYSDENLPAEIDIAGSSCKVLSYEKNDYINSKLVCQTSAKPVQTNQYPGSRGIYAYRQSILTAYDSLSSAQPSANAAQSLLNQTNFIDIQTVDVTVWLKGYLSPGKSSNYEFQLQTNGYGVVYLTFDKDGSKNRVLINSFLLNDLIF